MFVVRTNTRPRRCESNRRPSVNAAMARRVSASLSHERRMDTRHVGSSTMRREWNEWEDEWMADGDARERARARRPLSFDRSIDGTRDVATDSTRRRR